VQTVNKISRRVFLGTGAAAATVAASQLITSCSNKQENKSAPKAAGEINLYSSRHYNTDNELYQGFTRETGIKVNLVEGKADELIERIKSEGKNSPADVLVTVDVARLWRSQEAGIFAPISSKTLQERIPAYLREPQGYWFGFSTRARVIMYNKERVKPSQLSTYEELANPKWKGKLLIRSSNNTYNQSLVAAMIVAHGEKKAEEWCRGLVANFARPPEGADTAQIEGVAAGIGDLALANTYYLARYKDNPDAAKREVFEKVGVFFPNQKERGAHVNVSGAGVIKTAPNQEGAVKFLEYLTSKEAQNFFAEGNFEYPAVKGVPLNPIVASFGSFKPDVTDIASYGPNLALAVQIMDRAGWK
jgi:iron(III) transport system substrate-binding protein